MPPGPPAFRRPSPCADALGVCASRCARLYAQTVPLAAVQLARFGCYRDCIHSLPGVARSTAFSFFPRSCNVKSPNAALRLGPRGHAAQLGVRFVSFVLRAVPPGPPGHRPFMTVVLALLVRFSSPFWLTCAVSWCLSFGFGRQSHWPSASLDFHAFFLGAPASRRLTPYDNRKRLECAAWEGRAPARPLGCSATHQHRVSRLRIVEYGSAGVSPAYTAR